MVHDINICKRCETDTLRKEPVIFTTQSILFGKYKVLSSLGTGNSSTVYLAEHLKLKVPRAIKCIPKCAELESSFSLEASLLKNLNHPGIPIIYDIEEDDDYFYLIEEFIQGESLDTFVLHQESISQDFILNIGISLCDILDYLHNLSPYPILYQDLKPEHIILCGNQIKLVDFGIAAYISSSDKFYQTYGTKDFLSPEARNGLPVTTTADIYALGKVLLFITDSVHTNCSCGVIRIMKKAAHTSAALRYQSAALLRTALQSELESACHKHSHLFKKIIVSGSNPGAGATFFAAALVSVLNKNGYSAIYKESESLHNLTSMANHNPHFQERNGIYYYEYFQGIPEYGTCIQLPLPEHSILVENHGVLIRDITELDPENLIIFLMDGSDWQFEHAIETGNRFKYLDNVIFVCNFGNAAAAKKFTHALNQQVYCFPVLPSPYRVRRDMEQLIFHMLSLEGGNRQFFKRKGRKANPAL